MGNFVISKQTKFIRLSGDRFIPIIKTGNTNLRTSKGGIDLEYNICLRKEESIVKTEQQIDEALDRMRQYVTGDCEIGKKWQLNNVDNFGWFAGIQVHGQSAENTSFADIEAIYKKGINTAKTVEQFGEIVISWRDWNDSKTTPYTIPETHTVRTEQQLTDALLRCQDQNCINYIEFPNF